MGTATAQVAACVLISSILAPVLASYFLKRAGELKPVAVDGEEGVAPAAPLSGARRSAVNPVIAIVSDDLTGSGDTAVQFVRAGWSTHLSIGGADEALAGDGQAEVLAVTTHSRALPADQAAGIVRANVERLRQAGVKRLYKKVDSTLQGPFWPKSKRPAPPGRRTRSRSSALLFRHRPDRVRRRAAGERQTGHRDLGRDRPGHAGHRKPYPQPAPMRPCRPGRPGLGR